MAVQVAGRAFGDDPEGMDCPVERRKRYRADPARVRAECVQHTITSAWSLHELRRRSRETMDYGFTICSAGTGLVVLQVLPAGTPANRCSIHVNT